MTRARRPGQLGFTLVEVMVSLVVSSLLVGMVLAIFSRLSVAYRGQQSIAELHQILSAGHERIESDLRQAGFQVPDGFFVAGSDRLQQPVVIVDNAGGLGPDELRIFAADASAVARVLDFNGGADTATAPFTTVEVDTASDFVAGDLAVIVKAQDGLPTDVAFYPCVVQIDSINGTELRLATGAPWGTSSNDQCDQVRTDPALGPDRRAMVYRFRARAYRIDGTRPDLAVLQLSQSGGFVDDWEDLGIGFTDLQIASLWDDTDDDAGASAVDTDDVDADPTREWWSDATQTTLSQPLDPASPIPPAPLAMSSFDMLRSRLVAVRVSLVLRTHRRTDLTPSQRTPALVDPARPANNDLGNRDSMPVVDERIYRHATVGTDLRNMGVGL